MSTFCKVFVPLVWHELAQNEQNVLIEKYPESLLRLADRADDHHDDVDDLHYHARLVQSRVVQIHVDGVQGVPVLRCEPTKEQFVAVGC